MRIHENMRVVVTDTYFVCGGNPDGSGGGVITTTNRLDEAHALQIQAIKQNYSMVRVLTYAELMEN